MVTQLVPYHARMTVQSLTKKGKTTVFIVKVQKIFVDDIKNTLSRRLLLCRFVLEESFRAGYLANADRISYKEDKKL